MIYPNKSAAQDALSEAENRLSAIMEELGLRFECEDSCCATYFSAEYRDENGRLQTLSSS
jgi:regulator of sigma D